MSRLSVMTGAKMRTAGETIRGQFVQRIAATPPGVCAVEQTLSILKVCHAQSCGKCVPCRDGLGMLEDIMEDILNNKATMASLELLKQMLSALPLCERITTYNKSLAICFSIKNPGQKARKWLIP